MKREARNVPPKSAFGHSLSRQCTTEIDLPTDSEHDSSVLHVDVVISRFAKDRLHCLMLSEFHGCQNLVS